MIYTVDDVVDDNDNGNNNNGNKNDNDDDATNVVVSFDYCNRKLVSFAVLLFAILFFFRVFALDGIICLAYKLHIKIVIKYAKQHCDQ